MKPCFGSSKSVLERVNNDDNIEHLRDLYEAEYGRCSLNDPSFENSTEPDLLVRILRMKRAKGWRVILDENEKISLQTPEEAEEAETRATLGPRFSGDPEIDEWERQLASGMMPDLGGPE